jgi:Flp pilus assembly protein TadB
MSTTEPLKDISRSRARRKQARRRRHLARLDFGLGLLLAVVALLVAPGIAIVALVALLALVICALSVVLERRRSRRR